jgi:hypothetical protein
MIGVAAAFWKWAASGNVKPSQLAEFKKLIDTYNKTLYVQETANLYGLSEQSLYRALAQRARPRALRAQIVYAEDIAARQDGVLLRTHRRPQGSDIE